MKTMKPFRERTILAKPRCRYRGCTRAGDFSRGLCHPHYMRAWRRVNVKCVTTWDRLIATGKCDATASEDDWFLEDQKPVGRTA